MKMMTDQMEPAMIAWLRFMGYSIVLIPLAFWRAGWQAISPPRRVIQIIRGVLLAVGNVSFIIGVQYVDFADAIAILYVYPFLMILFAPLVLGETIARSAWIGVVGGFTGVVLVMRPDPFDLDIYAMLIVITGLMISFQMLINRKLGVLADPIVISMWGGLVATLSLTPFIYDIWVPVAAWPYMTLIALAIISALAQVFMVMGFARGTAGLLAPFTYSEIVSAVIVGLVFFGTWPDIMALAGIALIIASGIVVARAQGQLTLRRREKL
jgi:drug/metabolite transporter (DMT)-like permease